MLSKEALESILLFITILWFVSGLFLSILTGSEIITIGRFDIANIIGFGCGIVSITISLLSLNAQWRYSDFVR
jgi:hypothetical protein